MIRSQVTDFLNRRLLSVNAPLAIAVLSSSLYVPQAQACRDCPFPMRVAAGRWILPNSNVEVDITPIARTRDPNDYEVTLRDASTGAVIAQGISHMRRGARSMNVELSDNEGGEVDGTISMDDDGDQIQAKFKCTTCTASAEMALDTQLGH